MSNINQELNEDKNPRKAVKQNKVQIICFCKTVCQKFTLISLVSKKFLTLKLSPIVHELEPKKWVFGSSEWAKHYIDFCDVLPELVAFDQKLRYFIDQNRKDGDHMKMHFKYFQIQR